MVVDLQKASLLKRMAAWIFDVILVSVLAVGFGVLLAMLMQYDKYSSAVDGAIARYEKQYGVVFDISEDAYGALTAEEKEQYDAAYEAMIRDEEVVRAYNMVLSQTMIIVTVGILLSMLVLEFFVPLWLKNGQTLGKKIFSLGVIRTDFVKISGVQLFARTILGKFTIETMIPIYIFLLSFFGALGVSGTLILFIFLAAEVVIVGFTRNHSMIHDLFAGTVTVDLATQRVFESQADILEYTKRIHAEKAAREEY